MEINEKSTRYNIIPIIQKSYILKGEIKHNKTRIVG